MNAKLHKAVRQLKRNTLDAGRRLEASERIVRYNARLAARTQPKAQPERKHKSKKEIRPTWPNPNRINQLKQSRPLIVLHPVRALKRQGFVNAANCEQMALVNAGPKHELDSMAVSAPNFQKQLAADPELSSMHGNA